MRQLYVLRHGIAYPHGTPEFEEDERPLTPKGRHRMKQAAKGMRRLGVAPDRIVSSPLPRAWGTAEIVAEVLGLEGRLEMAEALMPGRSAASIRRWLDVTPGETVMIVGHDPAFSELVSALPLGPGAPTVTHLEKGGLACFAVDASGRYVLEWLATPRMLRRLRG